MAMAFAGLACAVDAFRKRSGRELARISAQPHRPAHRFDADQIAQLEDNRMRCVVVKLGRVRALQPAYVASELDRRALHSQTYPEIRRLLASRVVYRSEHARYATF